MPRIYEPHVRFADMLPATPLTPPVGLQGGRGVQGFFYCFSSERHVRLGGKLGLNPPPCPQSGHAVRKSEALINIVILYSF